jgi:pimeloyl-ACP methyl ester carboxylesterase
MLVGHSFGATLALAYAAAHPYAVESLTLIGCGTFDAAARARLQATREERIDAALREKLERLRDLPDPDARLRAAGELLSGVDSYDADASAAEPASVDARAHEETWEDALRLQREGLHPAAFASIEAPVLMLHGAADPHPGPLIRVSLAPYVRRLAYHEWPRCGHYPWLERAVREDFFARLRRWLLEKAAGEAARQPLA